MNPDWYFVELKSYCNMHCPICPSDILKRKNQCKIIQDLGIITTDESNSIKKSGKAVN